MCTQFASLYNILLQSGRVLFLVRVRLFVHTHVYLSGYFNENRVIFVTRRQISHQKRAFRFVSRSSSSLNVNCPISSLLQVCLHLQFPLNRFKTRRGFHTFILIFVELRGKLRKTSSEFLLANDLARQQPSARTNCKTLCLSRTKASLLIAQLNIWE